MPEIISLEHFNDFDSKITEFVEKNGCDYIDAVLEYCALNNLEIEMIGELIARNPELKSKIEIEAENLHFLRQKTDRLPI